MGCRGASIQDTGHPISSPTHTLTSMVPACALQGGWQIPLHTGPPDREDPTFHAESLAGQPRVTCASLLIRIMKLDAARLAARRKLPNYADRSGSGPACGIRLLFAVVRKAELGHACTATWHNVPDKATLTCLFLWAFGLPLIPLPALLSIPASTRAASALPSQSSVAPGTACCWLHVEGRLVPCACLPAVQQQHLRCLRLI